MTYIISQENIVNDYPNNDFMRFFRSQVKTDWWKQTNGIDIFYAFVINKNAKKSVLISSGRSESVIKYAEFIYELYQNGYSVFVIDHQGQGQSSRLIANRQIGYVKHFDDYVDDLDGFIKAVVNPILVEHEQNCLPKVLFCHSMGGAIGALYVQKHPNTFSRLILCAPMIGVQTPLPEWLMLLFINAVTGLRKLLGLPVVYVWGQTNYESSPFTDNQLTNSKIRYRVFRKMMSDYPINQLGGISFEWLQGAFNAMSTIRKNANTMNLPTLVFQAQQEQIVDNNRMNEFVEKLPNVRFKLINDAQHELLFERDGPRAAVLTEIFDFLSESKK